MSVESIAIALHHSRATGTAKLVLIGIANHDGDGGAWPSVATLCTYAGGVDRRNVQRAVEQLQELGEIDRKIMAGGTRTTAEHMRPNLYAFTLTCPEDCDRTKNHRKIEPVDNEDGPRGASATPRRQRRPPRGGSAAPPAAPAPPEPSYNQPAESNGVLPKVSTGHAVVCWSCGQPRTTPARKYCTDCSNHGRDTPIIECDGCGGAGRRTVPGQQSFTCSVCNRGA